MYQVEGREKIRSHKEITHHSSCKSCLPAARAAQGVTMRTFRGNEVQSRRFLLRQSDQLPNPSPPVCPLQGPGRCPSLETPTTECTSGSALKAGNRRVLLPLPLSKSQLLHRMSGCFKSHTTQNSPLQGHSSCWHPTLMPLPLPPTHTHKEVRVTGVAWQGWARWWELSPHLYSRFKV